MTIRFFASYINFNKNHERVELYYSCLHFISGNQRWYCRIWAEDWMDRLISNEKVLGESYGRNKFEAYRLALNDLRNSSNNLT